MAIAGVAGVVVVALLVGGASVAVLPCIDVSAARDHEYFGDGITEETAFLLDVSAEHYSNPAANGPQSSDWLNAFRQENPYPRATGRYMITVAR
jgi:hypothetical protein